MMDRGVRLQRFEEVVHRLSGALNAARMYSSDHPSVAEHCRALVAALGPLYQTEKAVLIGFLGGEVIADDTPLLRASAYRTELIRDMQALGVHRVIFERGVTEEEVRQFVHAAAIARPEDRTAVDDAAASDATVDFLVLAHLRAGRIPVDGTAGRWGSSFVSARQVQRVGRVGSCRVGQRAGRGARRHAAGARDGRSACRGRRRLDGPDDRTHRNEKPR